jgi:iron complex transport system substrate-binding protein
MKHLFICLLLSTLMAPAVARQKTTAITLSPHLTELVYSAGGAEQLVGVSAYSNYPQAATQLPVIGDAFRLDLEQIKLLDPTVIFYWHQGTATQVVSQLNELNFNTVKVDIRSLSDIPRAIRQIADTLGTSPLAETQTFSNSLEQLRKQTRPAMTALIQIADKPIYTVGGQHWMTEAIAVCGLSNVYQSLEAPSAAVTLESAIAHNPQVIITTLPFDDNSSLAAWAQLEAIDKQQVVQLEADHFTRPTLRLLLAIEHLCTTVDGWHQSNLFSPSN